MLLLYLMLTSYAAYYILLSDKFSRSKSDGMYFYVFLLSVNIFENNKLSLLNYYILPPILPKASVK